MRSPGQLIVHPTAVLCYTDLEFWALEETPGSAELKGSETHIIFVRDGDGRAKELILREGGPMRT
jgi:hypothetical protein